MNDLTGNLMKDLRPADWCLQYIIVLKLLSTQVFSTVAYSSSLGLYVFLTSANIFLIHVPS